MSIIILRKFLSISGFLRVVVVFCKIRNFSFSFLLISHTLSCPEFTEIISCLFFSLWTWKSALINIWTLTRPYIPGIHPHLIMIYYYFYILLCWSTEIFFKTLFICVDEKYQSEVLSSCKVFVWLECQSNSGLMELVGKDFFSFLEELT